MATLVTLAQYRMDYGDHMDGAWGWAMGAFMILAAVAVVALVVWLVRSTATSHTHPHSGASSAGPGSETPVQILDRRLAHGEITPEEHRERAAILNKN